MKKILIIGSGGREHALGWKFSQSEEVSEVWYAPGNAGTQEGKGKNANIDGTKKENFQKLFDLIKKKEMDLTIVGPEIPLVEGLVDFLNNKGYNKVFGPTQSASRLESDKFYSYDLMNKLNIPQAESVKCLTFEDAQRAIEEKTNEKGIVIKARGLTAGKGVSVCDSKKEALNELRLHSKKYGEEVLIAERLFGQEFSVFGISDGNRVLPLEISVQDHKREFEGDRGRNTGGMGAYCPVPIFSSKLVRKIIKEIMNPLILKMKEEGNEYKGFLYAGMIMCESDLKVIEFNVRFGDPECQPVMTIIKSDLYKIISKALEGKLNAIEIKFNPGASCCVILASKGYPGDYEIGFPIFGLEDVAKMKDIKVFHSGTKLDKNKILTNGGRVLGVTAYSLDNILSAQQLAYKAVSKINILGGFHYRKDISEKSLK